MEPPQATRRLETWWIWAGQQCVPARPGESGNSVAGVRSAARPYTLAWLHRWRGILIRWERKATNYLGLLQFACALLWFRRLHRLTNGSPQRYVR